MTDAFLSWQVLVLVAVLLLGVYFQKQRPSRLALTAIVCYGASIFLFNVWALVPSSEDPLRNKWLLDYAYKVFNAGINGQLVVYLTVVLYFVFIYGDLVSKLLWITIWIGEVWGWGFNNITCNLILEMAGRDEVAETWGGEASKYVCGREVGEWAEYIPLVVTIGAIVWLIHRYSAAKRQLKTPLKDN